MNEKIIELAKKLKALADRGVGGEKVNAEMHLQKLMKKYNLTMEDVVGEVLTYRQFPAKSAFHKKFIHQVISNVVGPMDTYKHNGKKYDTYIELTDAEYLEVSEKLKFYWSHFTDELDIFYAAFIHKNDLWQKRGTYDVEAEKAKQQTPEEREKIKRIFDMASVVETKNHLKSLGNGKIKK